VQNGFHLRAIWTSDFAPALAVCALLSAIACASQETPPSPVGEVRQADSSDGGAGAPAARAYAVFGAVDADPEPGARDQMGLVFDSARGKSVLFGGSTIAGPAQDTWAYDGEWEPACAPPCAIHPSARSSAAMAFAKGRGVVVLFGGFHSPSALCDTWEWNGATRAWQAASEPACTDGEGAAARRSSHAMAELGDDAVLFGGSVLSGSKYVQSTALLRWDGSVWKDLCDADCKQAGLPTPRSFTTLSRAHTAGRDVLILFGGQDDTGTRNDTWQFDPATSRWSELCTTTACKASAPAARIRHGAAFDAIRGKLVVHGGCANNACAPPYGDAFEYDPARDTWEKVPPGVDPDFPDKKSDFGMAFDATRGRIVEFGGLVGGVYLDRTVEYYTRGGPCAAGSECNTGTCSKRRAADPLGVCTEPCDTTGPDSGVAGACVGGFRCDITCDAPCQTCAALPGICTAITSGPDDERGDPLSSRCTGVNTCAANGASRAGQCLLIAGQTCGDGADCASGNCGRYGNHVCSEPGCGDRPCRPSSASGTCTTFGAGHFVEDCQGRGCGPDGNCLERCDSDDDCDPAYYCDTEKTHDCKRGNRYGAACKSSAECDRGTCYDGVCCEEPCGGACQKCGDKGRCVPIEKGAEPLPGHPRCLGAGSSVCAGYCDGVAFDCAYPEVPCGDGTCVAKDWRSGQRCDHGACTTGEGPTSCGAFACDRGTCNTECNTSDQCRRGAVCDLSSGVGTCNDVGVTCASDGVSVKTPSGAIISCDGYKCSAGVCAFRPCSVDTDCAPGFICGAGSKCVEKDGTPTRDAGTAGAGAGLDSGGKKPMPEDAGPSRKISADAGEGSRGAADTGCAMAPGPQHRGRAGLLGLVAGFALVVLRRRRW
jgi:hypothetical protein